jgi:hypothetical protein
MCLNSLFLPFFIAGSEDNPAPNKYSPVDISLYKPRSGKFSMRARTKIFEGDNSTPSPTSTLTVSTDVFKPRAPKFSLRGRLCDLKGDLMPAPNCYTSSDSKLKTMSRYPAYTMRGRLNDSSRNDLPSSAHYDLMKYNPFCCVPKYSMRSRHSEYSNTLRLPIDDC